MTEATITATWAAASITVATCCTYLGLNKEAVTLYALLLGIDFATGVAKAYRTQEAITSARAIAGMIGKLLMLLVPISVAIGFRVAGVDGSHIIDTGVTILALSEVYSIISNIHAYKYKQSLPEFDAVAILGRMLREKITKILGDGNDQQ